MNGPEVLIPIFSVIGFFASIITFIYMRYKSRHAERMALIEENRDASIFNESSYTNKYNSLKYGLLLTGVGAGWFFGLTLENMFNLEPAVGIVPTVLMGGGIGLISYYFLVSKLNSDLD